MCNTNTPTGENALERFAIVFFHGGSIPKYLICAIESARVFNPSVKIYLITNQKPDLTRLNVDTVQVEDLKHPKLEVFRKCYKHISAANEIYERTCFERWFYIDQLITSQQLNRVVYLDSDCLLFANIENLFRHIPQKTLCASRQGGPACAFINGCLNEFLSLILETFRDATFLSLQEDRLIESQSRGGMANLTDMSLIEMFTTSYSQGYVYPNSFSIGHIDHCINVPDGMEYFDIPHRKRKRKKVYWLVQGGRLYPFLRDIATRQLVPALTLHYQSGAKRLIRRFNHHYGVSYAPLKLRVNLYNWMHGGWGSKYI
jgi:hypothetical protein